ncbi:hypothetical protein BH23PSE2_BH23PSE2_05330 [soil metagenome]
MKRCIFLLPEGACFGAQRLPKVTATALGRADTVAAEAGRRAQLRRHFPLPADAWPIAALSRQQDVGDADGALWLRADPAWLRADINGARLIAHGASLGVSGADAAALLPALKPLFGDAGMVLDAPAPDRWYLRLQGGSLLPDFSDPGEALGADLFDHGAEGDQAPRWRTLSGEAQILLHNHAWNAQRVASGQLPINALWFWGGGGLPVARTAPAASPRRVFADDPTVQALAGNAFAPLPPRFQEIEDDALYDLGALRDLAVLDRNWLQPALQALEAQRTRIIMLDAADGFSRVLRRGQRWRVWRRPLRGFAT